MAVRGVRQLRRLANVVTRNDKKWPEATKIVNFFVHNILRGGVKSVMLLVMNSTKNILTAPKVAEITVPNDRVFKTNPISYELTDYAYDLGARVVDSYRDAQGNNHVIGETWVSGTQGHQLNALTYYDVYSLPHDQIFLREVRAAGDGQVGVAPCFVNPEALGIGMQTIDGEDYLTIFNRSGNYPQERIREPQLHSSLQKHKLVVDAQDDIISATYALPRYRRASNSPRGEVGCLPVRTYEYRGQQYAYAGGEWYHCGPIKVTRQENGNIQCKNLLFAAPHGDGRGAKSLYAFLNHQFLADLVKHSTVKLSHLQLGTTALKTPSREQ